MQSALAPTRKSHDLPTPSGTAPLQLATPGLGTRLPTFFPSSILYKSMLVGEILLGSGGTSLDPFLVSIMYVCFFLTASKGCSEVNKAAPRSPDCPLPLVTDSGRLFPCVSDNGQKQLLEGHQGSSTGRETKLEGFRDSVHFTDHLTPTPTPTLIKQLYLHLAFRLPPSTA